MATQVQSVRAAVVSAAPVTFEREHMKFAAFCGKIPRDMLHNGESLPKDATEHHAACLFSTGL